MKIDLKNIDWEKIVKDTLEVLWLGFCALVVLLVVIAVVILFCSLITPVKIGIGVVITVIVILGCILRFGFGVRDD